MKRRLLTLAATAFAAALSAAVLFACGKTKSAGGIKLESEGDGFTVTGIAKSSVTEVTIPRQYDGKPVTSISESAFDSCRSLAQVYIPESVARIGDGAFYCCRSLEKIIIPDGIINVGEWTFGGCSSLASVTLPESVTVLGANSFRHCPSLTRLDYKGTTAEWAAVEKQTGWNYGTGAYTVYCTDGTVQKYPVKT